MISIIRKYNNSRKIDFSVFPGNWSFSKQAISHHQFGYRTRRLREEPNARVGVESTKVRLFDNTRGPSKACMCHTAMRTVHLGSVDACDSTVGAVYHWLCHSYHFSSPLARRTRGGGSRLIRITLWCDFETWLINWSSFFSVSSTL